MKPPHSKHYQTNNWYLVNPEKIKATEESCVSPAEYMEKYIHLAEKGTRNFNDIDCQIRSGYNTKKNTS